MPSIAVSSLAKHKLRYGRPGAPLEKTNPNIVNSDHIDNNDRDIKSSGFDLHIEYDHEF